MTKLCIEDKNAEWRQSPYKEDRRRSLKNTYTGKALYIIGHDVLLLAKEKFMLNPIIQIILVIQCLAFILCYVY